MTANQTKTKLKTHNHLATSNFNFQALRMLPYKFQVQNLQSIQVRL